MAGAQKIGIESKDFQPRNDLILVKPVALEKGEETTDSGIVIAITQNQSITDRPTSGEVISHGTDCAGINVGDMVIWPETDGIDLTFNDGEFMLLREPSIIGFKK